MALDSVVIKISSETKGVKAAIDDLVELGLVDKKNAEQFKKTASEFKAAQESIVKQAEGAVGANERLNDSLTKTNTKLRDTKEAIKGVATVNLGGLNNSISQIGREMPAFANSMNTGFMAISNNLPIFFDAIEGIKKQNVELAANGQKTQSVLSALGSALFSWTTALNVGITLLTVYGGTLVDWISNMFKSEEVLNENQKAFKKYTDEIQKNETALTKHAKVVEGIVRPALNAEEVLGRLISTGKVVGATNNEISETINYLKKSLSELSPEKMIVFANENIKSQKDVDNEKQRLYELEKQRLLGYLKQLEVIDESNNKNAKSTKESVEKRLGAYDALIKKIHDLQEAIRDEITLNGTATHAQKKQYNELNSQLDLIKNSYELATEGMHTIATKSGADLLKTKELEKGKIITIGYEIQESELSSIEKTRKAREKAQQQQIQGLQTFLNGLASIVSSYEALQSQLNQQALQRDLDALDKKKEHELANKKLTAAQKLKLDKKYEAEATELKRQAFEKDKEYKKKAAIINGALAITNAFTTGNPYVIAAQIALTTVMTAIQVAQIDAQKFAKGGWVKGKSHAQGGVHIEAEGDEFIVNKHSAPRHKKALEAINNNKFDEYIMNHIIPSTVTGEMQSKRENQLLASMVMNGLFDDGKLRRTIEQSEMKAAHIIVEGLKLNHNRNRYWS